MFTIISGLFSVYRRSSSELVLQVAILWVVSYSGMGVIGSIVGGFVGSLIGCKRRVSAWWLFLSLLGAILLLLLWRKLVKATTVS